MEGGKYQMSGFCRRNRRGHGFRIAHLAYHNNIHILAEGLLERSMKILGINADFPLVNKGFIGLKNIFNRVFNRNNVLFAFIID